MGTRMNLCVTVLVLSAVSISLPVAVGAGTVVKGGSRKPVYPAPKLSPKVDADLSDWAGVVPVCLYRREQAVYEGWRGAKDLSAQFWVAWDEKRFYFAAQVWDDVFHQPHDGAEVWRGDSIQIAFDVLKKGSHDYEYGFALTRQGPRAWRWHGELGDVSKIALAAKKAPGGLQYEAAIPWECLQPSAATAQRVGPESGRRMGFTMLVNDADEAKREGWIEWTPGIGKSKNPAAYGTLLLVPSQTPEVISQCFEVAELRSAKPRYGCDDTEVKLLVRICQPFAREANWTVTIRAAKTRLQKSGATTAVGLEDAVQEVAFPLAGLPDGAYEARLEVASKRPQARCELTAAFSVERQTSEQLKARLEDASKRFAELRELKSFLLERARRDCDQGRFQEAAAALDSMAGLARMPRGRSRTLVPRPDSVSIPNAWNPYRIHGREFWLEMPFSPRTDELFKKAGIYDDPMFQDAAFRVGWRTMQEPDSPLYRDLLKRNNAVAVRSGYFVYDRAMKALGKEDYDRFVKDFGDRFIGMHGIHENMGWHASHFDRKAHTYPRMKKNSSFAVEELILPDPILDVAAAYEAHRRLYRVITLEPYYKVYCTTATMMNHFVYEMGAGIVSNEIAYPGGSNQVLVAFARGAGRQFNKPWGMYIAAWGGGVQGDASTLYNFRFPWCRRFFPKDLGGWDGGPYSAQSHSLQKRYLYVSYMSGANLIGHESDQFFGSIYVANFDRNKDYAADDWLPTLLRDKQYLLSDHGAFFREFYNHIVKKHDRGVPYAPIALLLDQHNGLAMTYARDHLLGAVPYSEADYMMRATINTLWPWEHMRFGTSAGRWEVNRSVSGPFGDVFDVLTSFAPLDVIKSYPAIVAVGRVGIDDKLAGLLKDYVRSGGTLVINVKQLPKALAGEDFLGCRVTPDRATALASHSTIDDSLIREDKPFEFTCVAATQAEPIVLSVGTSKPLPLVTRNAVGKGSVVLTTPDYMKPGGAKNKMLNLFSHLVGHLTARLVPFSVTGGVESMVNKTRDSWVVTLVNNEGVYKYPGRKEIIKPEEAKQARVVFRGKASRVLEWTQSVTLDADRQEDRTVVRLTVPPGEIRILEFK